MGNLWFGLVVGLIPYYINTDTTSDGWMLQVRALFWSLDILFEPKGPKSGCRRCLLRIPLIERLGRDKLFKP